MGQRPGGSRPAVIEAQQVGKLVKDGATVTVCGVSGTMVPEVTLALLEASFIETGHPRDLTLAFPCPFGYSTLDGADHFGNLGMTKRVIGSSYHQRQFPKICSLIRTGQIEGYCLPLGVFYQLMRDISAGQPGTFSRVGLGTIVDPRNGGPKLNSISQEDLVELVNVRGQEMLFYKSFPIDVAIIRGTTADEDGNISLEEEPVTMDTLHFAMAAHNSGGVVICQVRRLAAKGSIHPRMVEVPGILIDYIVVDPHQRQSNQYPDYNPAINGEIRVPEPPIPAIPLNAEKIISRRALMELSAGMFVNLGAGLPIRGGLPLVAREENVAPHIHFSIEHGALGGVNVGSHAHVNPTSLLTACDIMDFYHGGGIDCCFLGFMEVDSHGNVNLGRLGTTTEGPGGSIDIGASTKSAAFLGTFTYGGLEVAVGNGKLRIVTEGKIKKFVKDVQGIYYNAGYGRRKGQTAKYITERAVFELTGEGVSLIEVAPGVDVERDILGQMGFKPIIAKDLKQMSPRIFMEPPVGIGDGVDEASIVHVDLISQTAVG